MNFLKNFYNEYISLNLKDYPNIGIDFEINKLLFFVFLGLCVASFVINYYQSLTALILKKLIRAEAFSEEKSRTLASLGLSGSKPIMKILSKKSGAIKRTVLTLGERRPTYEEYIKAEKERRLLKKLPPEERKKREAALPIIDAELDFTEARFYIAPDMRNYAEHSYRSKNGSVLKTVLYCVLLLAVYFALVLAMPSLLTAIDSIMA